ncbi:MAG: serine hydrolase domain-containing protein [Bacteroidota bacterium]
MRKSKTLFAALGILLCMLFNFTYSRSQSLYFPPIGNPQWDTITYNTLGWCQNNIDSLYQLLDVNNTKAFILLKDGKIVLENYFGGFAQNDPWYWASAGKTITSFMTGIAQQEGFLDITDTTSSYIGTGWTACPQAKEEKITIRNQLTMTSGLDDGVPDPYCTLDTCLIYLADAGTRWAYHNGPYTLLDQVISSATGATLNSYTNQKLLTQTGMSGAFLPNGYNNVFYSNARSMARFGLLILNRGNWNGNSIMSDTTYFNQMVNTSQSLNPSYGYLWWLNGKSGYMVPGVQFLFNGYFNTDAPADMFAALGSNGQMINIVPSQNMVWIRMGNSPSTVQVPYLLNNEIWKKINLLPCNVGIPAEPNSHNPKAHFNVFDGEIELVSVKAPLYLRIHDSKGNITGISENRRTITIRGLTNGVYLAEAFFSDGTRLIKKILVSGD